MHVSPDPITTREQAAQERETLLDFIARGLYCTTAGALGTHTEPSAEVLTQARRVADDYLSAYEEWLVNLAADNAS
ncbi:hypothetical protein ADK56_03340 [Streptomyces sp. MMG1522]|uniref:hypothetical protein n=1 Tax=Streptomyces sp. MMG1522 TaxID=1415545 RepID=UPI0003C966E3|nr:hypothetical protein [Streptomyces sp. MMG1522]AGZ94111.1 hypothetical protein [Streptomyces sp. MMG1522]KOU54868.1 hypothetical protein ADK56_03340 [Streptomyces sp. MMG1522]